MDIPKTGSTIEINSLKHNQKLHRRWKENTVLYSDEYVVIGGNDQTIVEEPGKEQWRTSEPAIFYFDRRYWFNIIALLAEDDFYYYCNLGSPFTYNNYSIQYIDYEIDIIVQSDFTYKILDMDEFEKNKQLLQYSNDIELSIAKDLAELQTWIEERKNPFNMSFLNHWFSLFLC